MSSQHTLDDQNRVNEATRRDLLVMHHNFNNSNEFITSVQAWAHAQGFTVSRTGKNFSDHEALYAILHAQGRGAQWPVDVPWHIKFSFDNFGVLARRYFGHEARVWTAH
ncbi:hypothetical protein H257_10909 [Aphanomyces astaci]|uniref:Uncharacterized protein n=1 Tax=Aphanomyces astaci TaxID=112090 RepID=W4G5A4_APHAT|nr:hypothetical protein H257_10909 [Aphanomyces astaci]ETV74870.1 hypothetical protein H257_10909 [Aphanomyces astaci]|eukprot:XP_009835957.1 hypothetical protein H257_10909 [Aphanomyces astaci]